MPRQPSIDPPGGPQHIVQRGNDRQPTFFADADRVRYLTDLNEIALRVGCHVHAYVLMTNHVHLLATPTERGQIGHVTQSLGRRYVRYINYRYHRTGTLWEGRYKACPVQDLTHVLRCYRYIELNPVRAKMAADPGDYRWSSYRANAHGQHDPLVHPHGDYIRLSAEPDERLAVYRALVMEHIDPTELDAIREHLQRQHAYGTDRFRDMIERKLGRRAGPAKIGRPRKAEHGHHVESAL